jgi:ABC-type lipoprotein export system ATPase subunit
MGRRERLEFQRHSVGFVWQQTSRNLLPYLTAAENVAMAMILAGSMPARRREAEVDQLLDLLGVADCADRRPLELSGGQQQRVAIAVAIANSPRVLLADEPTGELDDAATAQVLDAMRTVNEERGVTVLIVTHDSSVSSHVRRTIQIRDGRTSTEVLRRKLVDLHGQEHSIAEEFAVLDRVGRMQLPADFMASLSLRDKVRLALETDHVGVWPGDTAEGGSANDDKKGNA